MRALHRFVLIAIGLLLVAVSTAPSEPFAQDRGDAPMGLGIAAPLLESGLPLYFRSGPEFDAAVADSVTFSGTGNSLDIATAPPWLVPEHLKLDYQIFLFRVVSISRHAVELLVNKTSGKTAWVHRADVTFRSWPEFFSEVFSVEQLDVAANPVRPRPFTYSDPLSVQPDAGSGFLDVLQVRGDWLQVQQIGDAMDPVGPPGWIRWRDGEQLLISWSLLS